MKSLRYGLVVFLFVGFLEHVNSQTTHQFSGWGAVFGNVKLNNKFSLHLETQYRSNDEWKAMQTMIFRPGLVYSLKNNQTLTLGYAFVDHRRTIDGVTGWGPEHRIWEQYVLNKSFNPGDRFISIQNRFRLEQRFVSTSLVSGDELKTDQFNFSQRLRYFVRTIVPLVRTSEKKFAEGVFISLQDEIFLNLNNSTHTNGKFFDQNRAYVSLGYRFSPKYDLEIGYMNQFILGKADARIVNNIMQMAFYFRL